MTEVLDGVIIGSGHNSLACAVHLAAQGWKEEDGGGKQQKSRRRPCELGADPARALVHFR